MKNSVFKQLTIPVTVHLNDLFCADYKSIKHLQGDNSSKSNRKKKLFHIFATIFL